VTRCGFKIDIDDFDESAAEYFEYVCPEEKNILDSGLCIFHDENYLKDSESKEANEQNLKIKLSEKLAEPGPLIGIGYHLPDLSFEEKYFDKTVNFSEAKFMGLANFSNTQFKEADFAGAEFTGEANFFEAEFMEKADFAGAEFTGEANFFKAEFTGDAKFFRAQFTGDSDFYNTQFRGEVDFSEAQSLGKINFSEAHFTSGADFSRAQFTTEVNFSKAHFVEKADFLNAHFVGKINFSNAHLTNEANFNGAQFTGESNFSEAFVEKADFSETQFTGDAKFFRAQFTGDAKFYKTRFMEKADFSKAQFMEKADFSKAQFMEKADFSRALTGNANFYKTRFMVEVDFIKALFMGEAIFTETQFWEESNFYKVGFMFGAEFSRSKFIQESLFVDTNFRVYSKFNNVRFGNPEDTIFQTDDLSGVSFIGTDISRVRFGENVKWGLTGEPSYLKKLIYADKSGFKILEEREIETLLENKQDIQNIRLGSVLAVYRSLRENYEYRLRYDEAGEFFIREMEMKRKYKQVTENGRSQIRRNNWIVRNFSLTGLYYHLSRYGQSFTRPTLFGIGIILFSTLLWLTQPNPAADFSFQSVTMPQIVTIPEIDDKTNIQIAFERSLTNFLPSLSFGYESNVGLLDVAFKIVGGAVTFGLIIIALRRKFERKFRH
jgi:uncharacterized protein YjbI with pentapeptide repeats